MSVEVNYLAVLLAAVAAMALGFLWYSPVVLGKPWMKLKGYSAQSLKADQKKMTKFYALSFILALVQAYVLTHVMAMGMYFFQYTPVAGGLSSAFWMWLGFVMPTQATATIFGDKKFKLLGIDTGYQLVSLLAMGLVLGYLQ